MGDNGIRTNVRYINNEGERWESRLEEHGRTYGLGFYYDNTGSAMISISRAKETLGYEPDISDEQFMELLKRCEVVSVKREGTA